MNEYHRANRDRWNFGAETWAAMHDRRGTWRIAHMQPEQVFLPQEMDLIGDADGRHVCVLGSGDNLAVFAFAGMGARVTSVDISVEQLAVAQRRARELGLTIEFVESDVSDLGCLKDASFDLVYTGGHVAVWVSDLRNLLPGGNSDPAPEGVISDQRVPSFPTYLEGSGIVAGSRFQLF